MVSEEIPFQIVYEEKALLLQDCRLSEPERQYTQSYLDRINRYRAIGFHDGSPVYSLYQPPLATKPGMRSLYFRVKRRFEGCRVPATATIAINRVCQCDCQHCSAVFYNASHRREMTFDVLSHALLETCNLGVTNIILLGGEPLLRKDIGPIITLVPKNLSVVTMFTNGEYLTKDVCLSLKNTGLMGVFVSLDDAKETMHDALRCRPGLFRKAMIGIENLQREGILVAISSYLNPQRLKENGFEEMMDLAKRVGVNEVTFFDAIPSGQWLRDTSCLLQNEDRAIIKEKVKYYRSQKDFPGLSVQSTLTSECGSAFCFAANTQFYLTAFGEMCPCDFTPLTIGTYPDKSIAFLWKKMIETTPYDRRAKSCRMQDPVFRRDYIEKIPLEGPYPYPIPE